MSKVKVDCPHCGNREEFRLTEVIEDGSCESVTCGACDEDYDINITIECCE